MSNVRREVKIMNLLHVSNVLGGAKVLGFQIENQMDLITLGSKGVTKDAVTHLAGYARMPFRQVASLLPISERTLLRCKPKQHLNKPVSEHVLQIAEVFAKGEEVFEDKERFFEWLKQSNTALGGKNPLMLLDSRFGIDMVIDELGRIETGVYS